MQAKINSRGFGILDIKFVDDRLGYACGGSGSLFKTGALPTALIVVLTWWQQFSWAMCAAAAGSRFKLTH